MAKNNKPASAYAKPHTMGGKTVRVEEQPGSGPVRNNSNTVDMSVGNIDKSQGEHGIKTSGIKIRGTGAATKGTMARGPMA